MRADVGAIGDASAARKVRWYLSTAGHGALSRLTSITSVRESMGKRRRSHRKIVWVTALPPRPGTGAGVDDARGVARLLRPIIPLPVSYSGSAYAVLPVVAVIVGVLSSLSGVRRAVNTDPAAAFAGA